MKKLPHKVLAIFCLFTILAGCGRVVKKPENEQPAESLQQTAAMDKNDVNTWLSAMENPQQVLLSTKEIAAYNAKIYEQEALLCYSIAEYPESVDGETVRGYLEEAKIPSDERYIGSKKADAAYYEDLQAKLQKDSVPKTVTVRFGVMSENALLRAFPTTDPSYEFPNDFEFDYFNDTLLKIGEPLAVLHETDEGWLYVQSESYRGWLKEQSVALASKEQAAAAAKDEPFLVVSANRVTLNENVYNPTASGLELFMGTRLPLLPAEKAPKTVDGVSSESGYVVLLPVRDSQGRYSQVQALVPYSADVHVGYLPYTAENVLRQGFKLLGDRHGWSGQQKSRDATALVRDVFLSFGFSLPRNSAQQAALPGESVSLAGAGDEQTLTALKSAPAGSLLAAQGHTAIYLGMQNGVPYALHSLYVVDEIDASGARSEKMLNAILATDLSLCLPGGESFLSALNSVRVVGKA